MKGFFKNSILVNVNAYFTLASEMALPVLKYTFLKIKTPL